MANLSPGSLICAFCQLLSRQCRSCVAISSYIWLLGLWQFCQPPTWQTSLLSDWPMAQTTALIGCDASVRPQPVTAPSCCLFLLISVLPLASFFKKLEWCLSSLVSLTLPEPGIQCRFLCAWILQLHCLLGFRIAIIPPVYRTPDLKKLSFMYAAVEPSIRWWSNKGVKHFIYGLLLSSSLILPLLGTSTVHHILPQPAVICTPLQ